jgi:hypothetical protein
LSSAIFIFFLCTGAAALVSSAAIGKILPRKDLRNNWTEKDKRKREVQGRCGKKR